MPKDRLFQTVDVPYSINYHSDITLELFKSKTRGSHLSFDRWIQRESSDLEARVNDIDKFLRNHSVRDQRSWTILSDNFIAYAKKGQLQIWNQATSKCVAQLGDEEGLLESRVAVLSKDLMACGYRSNTRSHLPMAVPFNVIKIWDIYKSECVFTFEDNKNFKPTEYITSLALLSPDEILCGLSSGMLQVWNFKHPEKPTFTWRAHERAVDALCVSPSGALVTGSRDGTIKIWNRDTKECLKSLNILEFKNRVYDVYSLSGDINNRLISAQDSALFTFDMDKIISSLKRNKINHCDENEIFSEFTTRYRNALGRFSLFKRSHVDVENSTLPQIIQHALNDKSFLGRRNRTYRILADMGLIDHQGRLTHEGKENATFKEAYESVCVM